jgi:lysophospholipase L1-like esterase
MADLGYFLQPDEACFYDLRPGSRYGYRDIAMDVINENGLRGPDIIRQPKSAVRIVCLGDSSTFGMCVSEQMTWVRQLEGILRERLGRNIEAINGGVIGYTVLQGLHKYETKLRAYEPDIAMLAFGAINEQMPALGATDVERARVWARDYQWHLRGISDHAWKLRFVQLLGRGVVEARWRDRRELVRKCQTAQASFDGGRHYQARMTYDEFEQYLTQFIEVLRRDQCLPILVNPHRRASTEQRYPQVVRLSEIIRQVGQANDVPVLDCNHLFKQNLNHEVDYFADTHHPNVWGNRVIAESAAEFLDPYVRELQ